MGYATQYFLHTAFTVGAAFVTGFLYYVVRVVLYRGMPAEDYGLFYAVFSFGSLVYPLLSLGFDPGMVPFVTRFREEGTPGLIKSLVLSVLAPQVAIASGFCLLVAVFAQPIGSMCFGEENAASLIRLVALYTVFFLLFKTCYMVMLGLQHVATRNLAEVARTLLCVASAFLLLRMGYGVEAAALAYVIGVGAGLFVELAALTWLRPEVVFARFGWRMDLVKEVFRPGAGLSVAFGGIVLFSQMDTVMLTLVRGDMVSVAAYQLATPTSMILYGLIHAVVNNFMPMVTTLWHRRQADLLSDGIGRIYEAAVLLVLPGTILLACFSDVIMKTLFQRDILNAPDAFNVLAVGAVLYLTTTLNLHILAGIGRSTAAAASVLCALAANLVLNLILIYLFGIRGAAMATVLSHLLSTAMTICAIREILPFRLPIAALISSLVGSVAMALVCVYLRGTALFQTWPLSCVLVACPALYLGFVGLVETMGYGRFRELARVIIRGFAARGADAD